MNGFEFVSDSKNDKFEIIPTRYDNWTTPCVISNGVIDCLDISETTMHLDNLFFFIILFLFFFFYFDVN